MALNEILFLSSLGTQRDGKDEGTDVRVDLPVVEVEDVAAGQAPRRAEPVDGEEEEGGEDEQGVAADEAD